MDCYSLEVVFRFKKSNTAKMEILNVNFFKKDGREKI